MFSESSLYREILDSLQDGVYFVDRERVIVFWNKGAERISGYSRLQVLGKSCYDNLLNHIDEAGNPLCQTECPLSKAMKDGQSHEERIYLLHVDGTRVPVWVRVSPLRTETGEITGAVEVFSDRPSLAGAFDRVHDLERMAAVDPQMGIANRRYTEVHLRSRIEESKRFGVQLGLLFMDVDYFHRISETYGQEIGSRVLRTIAGTMLHNLRPFDFVGRWDKQQIVALFNNVEEVDLARRAENLRMLVERSFLMASKPIRVTVSVGATLMRPEDTFESWMERASLLCERSKTGGRNKVMVE
jgi:diguanylate cyclase (GGDEF)-like protein/PAS domain S-box-containing protein